MNGPEATPWTPTHRTPKGGVEAWTNPDPDAPQAQRLPGKLDVTLVERGDSGWAKVRCHNGWETWVDERRLVPVAAPSPSPAAIPVAPANVAPPGHPGRGSRRLAIATVIVAVVALGGLITFLTRSSSNPKPRPLAAVSVPTLPTLQASLTAPAGWYTSPDGLTVARSQADLGATVPGGPRARLIANPPAPDLASIKDAFAHREIGAANDPEMTTVDGYPAVAISLAELADQTRSIVTRYISARTGKGHAALFILEDQGPRFNADKATLDSIPTLR